MKIQMTKFCQRQYKKNYSGTRLTPTIVKELLDLAKRPFKISPGYSDFSCVLSLKNQKEDGSFFFTSFKSLVVNKEKALNLGATLETAYVARNHKELAVLTEWITGIEPESAPWIHLILYNQEQLRKEGELIEADWGLVAVNTSIREAMEPMSPITAMRNALGIKEGGSGFSLDRSAYEESVAFWSQHIKIKLP